MGILSKHLGEQQYFEIDGDKIPLKPLGTEYLPHLLKTIKGFSGAVKKGNTEPSMEDLFEGLTDDSLNSMRTMVDATLKLSLPNESEEERKQFGLKYFMQLIMKIFEINQPAKSHEEKKKMDAIKRIQDRNVNPTTDKTTE